MDHLVRFLFGICAFGLAMSPVAAECPSADLTGDCAVDMEDLAVLVSQWMQDGSTADDMVLIPAGTFQMGDSFNEGQPYERPVHMVTLSPFFMSKYEVTNGQYCEFLNSSIDSLRIEGDVVYRATDDLHRYRYCYTSARTSSSHLGFSDGRFTVSTKGGRDMSNDPVVEVSWYGAAAYCNWLSEQEGRQPCYNMATWECDFTKNGYHLPTEAQWEYASRGGLSENRFPWGDTISHSQANFRSSTLYDYDVSPTPGHHPTWNDGIMPYTAPVGSLAPNGYGLYDMAANVSEWCDGGFGNYSSNPQTDPAGYVSVYRIFRGGSWDAAGEVCRVAHRDFVEPYNVRWDRGFRVSRSVEDPLEVQ